MMWIKNWTLKLWHDLFYKVATEPQIKYSLRCRQAVDQINLSHAKSGFQLQLHLSLCSQCRDYKEFSNFLKLKVADLYQEQSNGPQIQQTTQKLLKAFQTTDNQPPLIKKGKEKGDFK